MDLIKVHVGMRSDNFIRRTTQYFIFNNRMQIQLASYFFSGAMGQNRTGRLGGFQIFLSELTNQSCGLEINP